VSDLRSRLEAKARRTCTVPVQVEDPGPARARVLAAQRAYITAELEAAGDETKTAARDEAKAALEDAQAAEAACFVEVEFAALADDDMEAVVARYQRPDGEVDRRKATPVLAAACAVDEDLRNEAWWAEQLARPEWAQGEALDLYRRLLDLNWRTPPESLPKG
jgi:hypothetical protein